LPLIFFAETRTFKPGDNDGALTWFRRLRAERLVANAEAYYRVMYHGAAESWNLRDTHMFETLELLRQAKGPASKAIIWAHNSHIGDARFTEMGSARDELNIGQLVREHYGDETKLIGFGTHGGTVAAATDWDGPMETKRITPPGPIATNASATIAVSAVSCSICARASATRPATRCSSHS
jgi:erythromycin esterase-like protein